MCLCVGVYVCRSFVGASEQVFARFYFDLLLSSSPDIIG